MIRTIDLDLLPQYATRIKTIYQEAFQYSASAADFLIERITKSAAAGLHPLVLGAFDEAGQLVGFAFGFDFHPNNWWANQITAQLPLERDWYADTFEFNELAVAPTWQGRGYGRQLLQTLCQEVPQRMMLLGTAKHDNDAVIRLYEHFGFRIIIDSMIYQGIDSKENVVMARGI